MLDRVAFARASALTALSAVLLFACAETVAPPSEPGAIPEHETGSAALVYEHPYGYCEDTDEFGVPYAPARPLWSDFEGPHYDGIVHTDGSQSIRYPDYRNVSHNLSVLESLQFLLSMVQNVSSRVESAQSFLEDEEYLDATYGLIPQVDGHCVCLDGGCDPNTIMANAEAVVNDLIDVHQIEQLLTDYLTEKVDATIGDLEDLLTYFEDLINPSGGVVNTLEQTLYDAIMDEIAAAEANMIGPVADACDPTTWGDPSELAAAVEAAVVAAVADLEAELEADFATIQAAVELAIGTPGSVLNQLKADIMVIKGYFEGVSSFSDLLNIDWTELASTLEEMVPFYEDTIEDIQAAIDDVTEIWETLPDYVTRIETLGDDIYAMVMDELDGYSASATACHDAIEDALSYAGGYSPTDFLDNLTDALTGVVEDTWDDAKARIEATWQSIEDRITGIGLEDGLALWDTYIGDARALITSTLETCYMRGTRPECFDHCAASGATAQDDFIWMPVDFLQDPEALAAGAASGALFALEQTGWLDAIREWVATQMENDLGAAFTSVLGFLGDFEEAVENVLEFLGDAFAYVDLFTEGYHLGAYSELRPDLHMCIGYYGHGAYAQMGNLGGDNFSIGARYSSHSLSNDHRVQFRSGGFAVSAFGYDFSLLPGIEFNTQLNGWRMWDQTRPFGIPLGATIDPDTVGRLDVFNVVPMDRYPFGLTPGVPIGAFLVRDLFPSRPTGFATAQWPRPGVDAEWEETSVAVMSLGLNLEFTWPSDGPEVYELADIAIIPGILTVVPSFQIQLGVGWTHQTSLMLDRVQEMVNANLPPAQHLGPDDFGRDMHAMQAPDLTADNGTHAFVEPGIGIEAFLGFKIWKIKVGAGARVALAVNIRPGGTGGVVDMNAALADALTNSNPPADAPCDPVWDWQNTYSCNNTAFPESEGDYSCSPAEGVASCCMQIGIVSSGGTKRYSMCVDDWTGITAEYCDYLNIADAGIDDARELIEGLPGFLSGIKDRLLPLIDTARQVEMRSEWRADASCAERECGGGESEELFSTSGLNIQSLSECEQFGSCTLADGSVVHDVTADECEGGGAGWRDVSTAEDTTCAIDAEGTLQCWGVEDYTPVHDASDGIAYTQVTTNQRYVCAIREADSRVDCFRFVAAFELGQVTEVPERSTFTMIRAGETHVCGIRTDTRVECWGGPWEFGAASDPEGEGFQLIESGYNRSCAINADDLVICFGENVTNDYPLSDFRFTDVAMTGFLGVCGLDTTGGVRCGQMNIRGFEDGGDYCTADHVGAAPEGIYTSIEDQGACSICGSRPDGSVVCWGAASPLAPSFSGPIDRIAGYSHAFPNATPGGPLRWARSLCAILTDGSLECAGANREGFPDVETAEAGLFSAYTCRTTTTPELQGWTGDGCHPLQQGFPSACGCATDADCASGETCSESGQCTDGSPSYSCACDGPSDCGAGRICDDGACLLACSTDDDCAGGRECVDGGCAPPHGILTSEQIAWGMANVPVPSHLISTYAMSDILATLTLTVNLYVELSFKLFGKERKWRILDFNRGWDLGSTWKGWYQPGLEALYQDECTNPLLDEGVTNRYPRSLTSNPYDGIFDADGITDAFGICANGGVCRYRNPLPASQTDPGDYTRGNVGDVDAFLTYCHQDYPTHQENPDHSTNEGIVDGIVDTYEFAENVTLEIWARNQFCVDGVVWDEWLAGLEPSVDESGNITDEGLLGDYDCAYDDPVTGTTHTFSCGDITQEMLAIWGCLDPSLNLFANLLSSEFPGALTTHPTEGTIFDLDTLFVALPDNDPLYGPGASYDLNLANMVGLYRFWDSGFPIAVSNVGEKWLQTVDACFSARFDAPEESACECEVDSHCVEENGERCGPGGVCQQPLYDSPEDTTPEWVQAFCPIVYLDADVELCCGDGIVQVAEMDGGYAEECDEGPDGSDTCSASCQLLTPPPGGSCCMGDGVCFENLQPGDCAEGGGVFNPGQTCAELDYCEEDGGGDPDPIGACCTATACLENLSEARCDRIGTWHEGQGCDDVGFCEDTIIRYGACCTSRGCYDNLPEAECAGHGDFFADQTCEAIDYCAEPDPVGGCCLPSGDCLDAVTVDRCDFAGGNWSAGAECAELSCVAPVIGACCVDGACIEGTDAEKCEEESGSWNPGDSCVDVNYCREDPEPIGACCLGDACIDGVTEPVCERRGGDWSLNGTCDTVACGDPAPKGACCIDGACLESVSEEECTARGGDFNLDRSCQQVDYCREVEPTGSCCDGRECLDDVTERMCGRIGGEFSDDQMCAERECGDDLPPTGGCCLPSGLCIDAITDAECRERGGSEWQEGTQCIDCGCTPTVEPDPDPEPEPNDPPKCASAPGGSSPLWLALVGLAAMGVRRRR